VVQFIVPAKMFQRIVASGLYRMDIICFPVSHGPIGNAVDFLDDEFYAYCVIMCPFDCRHFVYDVLVIYKNCYVFHLGSYRDFLFLWYKSSTFESSFMQ
jgi:hypothetical protein